MKLSIVRHKKRKSKTNEKNVRKNIPAKRQRLRIKVSSMGRIGLEVEELHPKALEDMEEEGDIDELPLTKRQSKKQKRFFERSKTPAKSRNRNHR